MLDFQKAGLQDIPRKLGFAPGEVFQLMEYGNTKSPSYTMLDKLIRNEKVSFVSDHEHFVVLKFANYRESFTKIDIRLRRVVLKSIKK